MRLTDDQRRALRLLAGKPHGVTEAMMLAHGFKREMLSRLVLAELAIVLTDTMRAPWPAASGRAATMKVEQYKITDDGRTALDD